MGIGEEENVVAEVTFTACPLCLRPCKVGRALRAHLSSKAHGLTATSKPLTLEAAMNLAVSTFSVTAKSSFSPMISSAHVDISTNGAPMILDNKATNFKSSGFHLERVRQRACAKASASAANASVRKWRGGSGYRSDAKLSHPGLEAARDGDLQTLKNLIESGEFDPLRDVGPNNETAIQWCAGSGHVNIMCYLVSVGGVEQLKLRDSRSGRTAVHWAARNGRLILLEKMLRMYPDHVDLNVETFDGSTPFDLAAYAGHLSTLEWLFAHNVNANHKNNFGCNALFFACIGSQLDACVYLREVCGVDAFVVQNQGHTALHKAAYAGSRDICDWLMLKVGLDKTAVAQDAKGHTAVDLARIRGFEDLAVHLARFR